MIHHFPPLEVDINDHTFLVVEDTFFAKHKKNNKTEIKNIFLTENVLVFVLKGYKHLYIEDKTIVVTPQDVIFLKKGIYAMAEYFEKEEDFEAVLFFLKPKILQEVVAEHKVNQTHSFSTTSFLKIPTNPIIDAYKNQLTQYFKHDALKDKDILLLKQKEILLYLLKTVPHTQTVNFWSSVISTSTENLMYVVEKYIFQKLSLNDYAILTNKSLSSFKRNFVAIYKTPPMQWINQKRLAYSCTLLKNTNDSISDISEKCGFESLSYFTRQFKSAYNITPTAYRANR